MREDQFHEIQTPKKEQSHVYFNRKAKRSNVSKKLHQKIVKRNLNSAFIPVFEDDVINLSEKESIEQIESISEVVDSDQSIVDIYNTSLNSDHTPVSENTEPLQPHEESVIISPVSEAFVFDEDQSSFQSYIVSLNQYLSPSFVSTGSVDMTPSSSITTVDMTPSSSPITRDEATPKEINTINLEPLVKHLRESMFQVLHSTDIDSQYKKLLEALVKMVTEEFYNLHKERDMLVELFSKKVKFVLLSSVLGIVAVSTGFFLFSDSQSSNHGPPPT